jgi:hypothetical protein
MIELMRLQIEIANSPISICTGYALLVYLCFAKTRVGGAYAISNMSFSIEMGIGEWMGRTLHPLDDNNEKATRFRAALVGLNSNREGKEAKRR